MLRSNMLLRFLDKIIHIITRLFYIIIFTIIILFLLIIINNYKIYGIEKGLSEIEVRMIILLKMLYKEEIVYKYNNKYFTSDILQLRSYNSFIIDEYFNINKRNIYKINLLTLYNNILIIKAIPQKIIPYKFSLSESFTDHANVIRAGFMLVCNNMHQTYIYKKYFDLNYSNWQIYLKHCYNSDDFYKCKNIYKRLAINYDWHYYN